MNRDSSARKPVHVLTGFLGSGKTTMLNRWLADAALQDTAVIVNEFGAVGIDQHLLAVPAKNIALLENGCLCCVLREDLVATLEELAHFAGEGKIPAFRRVIIETTGLADPAPIVHSLLRKEHRLPELELGSVLAVIDPLFAEPSSRGFHEWHRQLAAADRILISKADMAGAEALERAAELARAVNPLAGISIARKDTPPPRLLTSWSGSAEIERQAPELSQQHRHRQEVESFCVYPGESLSWRQAALWLEGLVQVRGEDFLRIKGIVKVRDSEQPLLVQAVQTHFSPVTRLAEWPDGEDPRSRIVFITRGIRQAQVEAALETLLANELAL